MPVANSRPRTSSCGVVSTRTAWLTSPPRASAFRPAFLTARQGSFSTARPSGRLPMSSILSSPVLGSTAIHELSHIVRGHATSEGSRTHGFAREGDAERDAWAVKGAMLAASSTRATALAGRAAQVRLARNQPRAYTMFGYDSADRHHWHHNEPAPTTHLIRTPRNLLAVVKEDIVVLPVRPVLRPVPEVGDLVYLAEKRDDGDFFLVGPWVVLNREHEAAVMADKDRREVEKADKEHRGGSGPVSSTWCCGRQAWRQLVPSRGTTYRRLGSRTARLRPATG